MIAPTVTIASRPHRVQLENPGAPVPDGDGGYTHAWMPLHPAWIFASIRPATARDLERVAGGAAVQSSASHIVTGPYHAGVTTKTRMTFGSRVLQVTGVANVEERGGEMVLTCVEVVA